MSLTGAIQQYLRKLDIRTTLSDSELINFAGQTENKIRLKIVAYLSEKKVIVEEYTIMKDLRFNDIGLLCRNAKDPFCPFNIGLIKSVKHNKKHLADSQKTRYLIPENKLDDAEKYTEFMSNIINETKTGA